MSPERVTRFRQQRRRKYLHGTAQIYIVAEPHRGRSIAFRAGWRLASELLTEECFRGPPLPAETQLKHILEPEEAPARALSGFRIASVLATETPVQRTETQFEGAEYRSSCATKDRSPSRSASRACFHASS